MNDIDFKLQWNSTKNEPEMVAIFKGKIVYTIHFRKVYGEEFGFEEEGRTIHDVHTAPLLMDFESIFRRINGTEKMRVSSEVRPH